MDGHQPWIRSLTGHATRPLTRRLAGQCASREDPLGDGHGVTLISGARIGTCLEAVDPGERR